jgi:hypothetical protein
MIFEVIKRQNRLWVMPVYNNGMNRAQTENSPRVGEETRIIDSPGHVLNYRDPSKCLCTLCSDSFIETSGGIPGMDFG